MQYPRENRRLSKPASGKRLRDDPRMLALPRSETCARRALRGVSVR